MLFFLEGTSSSGQPFCMFSTTQTSGTPDQSLIPWSRYPILYCVLVLPLSIVCFISFHEEDISGEAKQRPVATFVVAIIFGLSGVFNALLYHLTRKPLTDPPPTPPTLDPPPIR
jgi:FtsH-binding integral membrane protein